MLDITLYRDDLSEIGPRPLVRPTNISVDIDDAPLLLVDDVLFTGRSMRAALDALQRFRPAQRDPTGGAGRSRRARAADPGRIIVGLKLKDVPRDHRVNVRLSETDGRR